jgi:hypothetical protein
MVVRCMRNDCAIHALCMGMEQEMIRSRESNMVSYPWLKQLALGMVARRSPTQTCHPSNTCLPHSPSTLLWHILHEKQDVVSPKLTFEAHHSHINRLSHHIRCTRTRCPVSHDHCLHISQTALSAPSFHQFSLAWKAAPDHLWTTFENPSLSLTLSVNQKNHSPLVYQIFRFRCEMRNNDQRSRRTWLESGTGS